MNDTTGKLIFQATLKRATLMEEWLSKHKDHYPRPYMEFSNTSEVVTGVCSCGASYQTHVVISIVGFEKAK